MNPNFLPQLNPVLLFAIYSWSLLWKGIALWRAAKSKQTPWFIAILVLSTLGILEIVYLFFFAKEKLKLEDIKNFKLTLK